MQKTGLILFTFALSVITFSSYSQANYWTWKKGPDEANGQYSFGTMGVASSTNVPPTRSNGFTWTDSTGVLWMYGGFGYAGANGFLYDLWKFNPGTNNWTFVNGGTSVNQNPNYGTQGVASGTNSPGMRSKGATWVDENGNLWLFGGASSAGRLNDMWKYNPATNMWTWMHGSSTTNVSGNYGTQGIGSASTTPGARSSSFYWTDNAGNFWLFGGYGKATGSNQGNLADLWKYDPSTNIWTYMAGTTSTTMYGNYGTQGTGTSSTKPGGRNAGASWSDGNGNLWLFGGYGRGANDYGILNDLWKYNIASGQWTWMKGGNAPEQDGVYGTQGIGSASNTPGSRYDPGVSVDLNGDLWLFGGRYEENNQPYEYYNDLWKYDVSNNTWTWVNGDNAPNEFAEYGSMNAPSENNVIGSRGHQMSWTDIGGEMWIFGGLGYDESSLGGLNDLWKNQGTCELQGEHDVLIDLKCWYSEDGVVKIDYDDNVGTVSYLWGDGSSGSTNNQLGPGTYVVLIEDAVGCTDSVEFELTAPPAIISSVSSTDVTCEGDSNGSATVSVSGGTPGYTYMWSNWATTNTNSNLGPGTYYVEIEDANGCDWLDSAIVLPGNALPTPNLGPDTMTTAATYLLNPGAWNAYLWQDGSTGPVYTVTTSGTYSVTVSDVDGCEGYDEVNVEVGLVGVASLNASSEVKVSPNPFTKELRFDWASHQNEEVTIHLYDAKGALVLTRVCGAQPMTIATVELEAGVYFYELKSSSEVIRGKLVK